MFWVIFCVLAFVLAAMFYSAFYDKSDGGVDRVLENVRLSVPDFSQLGSGTDTPAAPSPAQGWLHLENAAKWTYVVDGPNVELRRPFEAGPRSMDGIQFDAPDLVLTCYGGKFFLGIDTRLAITESRPGQASLRIAGIARNWRLGAQRLIYGAPDDLDLFSRSGATAVELPFKELGLVTLHFDGSSLRSALTKLPCNLKSEQPIRDNP